MASTDEQATTRRRPSPPSRTTLAAPTRARHRNAARVSLAAFAAVPTSHGTSSAATTTFDVHTGGAPRLAHVPDNRPRHVARTPAISVLHGTPVPVANPLLFCEDTDVTGLAVLPDGEGRGSRAARLRRRRRYRATQIPSSCRTASLNTLVDCTRRIRRTLDLRTSVVLRASERQPDAGRAQPPLADVPGR